MRASFVIGHVLWSQLLSSVIADPGSFIPHDLFGAAKAFTDQIILNPPLPASQVGAIWAKAKNELADWTLAVKFRVNGPEHGGKGMAIWYTADRGLGGPVFGSADKWDGLGLFLTANADGSGTLSGHLNDRSTEFAKLDSAGGNAFSLDRDFAKTAAETNAFGSCSIKYRNLGTPSSIKMSYNDGSLKVVHDDTLCFENYDLQLPSNYYFGASGQSGEFADSHELFGYTVTAGSHEKTVKPAPAASPGVVRKPLVTSSELPKNPDGSSVSIQQIMQKLTFDSDRMAAQIADMAKMKLALERIEAIMARLDGSITAMQHGVPSSDPNFSPKVVYEDLSKQIYAMEDKFVQMEKHIEKQTSHIVASLPPPANGPVKNAVYVLVLVQVILGAAYIVYRRRTEEKTKFL